MIIPFLTNLISNNIFRVLLVTILMDVIFGVLRAIREHKTNSAIGIDGIIRKVGMLVSIVCIAVIDYIVNINFIGFVPETVRQTINLDKIGLASVFNFLFIIFEFLSVLKNMVKCKLPIPKKIQTFLEKALKEYTDELDSKKGV